MRNQMQTIRVQGVDVLRWNPIRRLPWRPHRFFALLSQLPVGPRVDNFGDVIGLDIVRAVVEERGLGNGSGTLGALGSIIHMLPAGVTVWGSGVNGNSLDVLLPNRLDIRAVRGPRTRRYLMDRGVSTPKVYGDPGLLLARYWPESPSSRREGALFIPNHNDRDVVRPAIAQGVSAILPTERPSEIIRRIQTSELVVGTSLHAIVLAESFGVPARLVASPSEAEFKYRDYLEGTGRYDVAIARSVHHALDLGGERPPEWDAEALLATFPDDLFIEPS